MVKGRVRKPVKAKTKTSAATDGPASATPAVVGKGRTKKDVRKAARAEKGLRKHLKRLEKQIAAAAQAEARRLRKLEKARWRRQLLEAFLDEARVATAGRAASPSKATPAEQPAKPGARVKRPARARAAAAAETPAVSADAHTTGTEPKPIQAYCMREKKLVPMLDPKPVVRANGRAALAGTCPSCGSTLNKQVRRAAR